MTSKLPTSLVNFSAKKMSKSSHHHHRFTRGQGLKFQSKIFDFFQLLQIFKQQKLLIRKKKMQIENSL